MTAAWDDIRRDLSESALASDRQLRHDLARRAFQRVLAGAWPLVLLAPAAALIGQVVRWVSGAGGAPMSAVGIALAALAPPLACAFAAFMRRRGRTVGRQTALAVADHAINAEERLLAADDFIDDPDPTPFMTAAIEDARVFATRAREAEVAAHAAAPHRRRYAPWALAALLLGAAAVWLGSVPARSATDTPPPIEQVAAAGPAVESTEPSDDTLAPPVAARPPMVETADPDPDRRPDPAPTSPADTTPIPDDVRDSAGKTRSGSSAATPSPGGASDSRAAPSNQGQASSKPLPRSDERQRPATARTEPPPTDPKRSDEESGATAGRGASRGSNRNPATSDWTSRDRVASPEEDESETDEDIEDEDEEQESRGGVQPSLRDRRPPVSRDLRIGFGNQPNPDANGRGGPSGQKKSRGTASLVLGVPIPDRVKGQPNSGRTKVTQERVEPGEEAWSDIEAGDRTARAQPIGPVSERDLAPWMRDFIRNYFLTIRAERDTTTEQP